MIQSVAVTGATGFVGRHLVKDLGEMGYRVRCLTRGGKDHLFQPLQRYDVAVHKVSWDNKESIRRALKGVHAVVHAAAIHPTRSMRNRGEVLECNVEGTKKVLESIDSVDRFILVSSMRTLINRNTADGFFDGQSPYDFEKFDTPYGYSKYLSEKVCLGFMEEKGLPLIMINPTPIIGTGDIEPSPNGRFIQGLLEAPVVFMVETTYSFVDVKDVARAIERLLHAGAIGKRYPLCAANWPLRTFIEKALQSARRSKPIVTLPIPVAYLAALCFEGLQTVRPAVSVPLVRSSVHFAKLKPLFDGSKIEEVGFSYTDPEETVRESVQWLLENHREKA